jgi:hypothetical protein
MLENFPTSLQIFKHRKGTPTNSAIQDAGRKARILMSKLISAINIVPSSLFITDVNIVDLDAASMAGFGYGFYKGQEVAVQRLYKGSHKEVRCFTSSPFYSTNSN